MVLSLVLFACTILNGLLYTIVKLIWKLIVPTLVLVNIFWFREHMDCRKVFLHEGMAVLFQSV